MIITENAKREIESLIPEHEEALVMYGADMYRQGIFTGAFYLALGVGLGFVIQTSVEVYKHRKNEDKKKES